MPERTRQVYGYIYKPDNTPYTGVKVEVRLVHPYWGKYYTKQYADTPLITVTDDNGYWTLTLVVNEDYEPYKETYYNVNCYRPEDNKLYMCFSFYLPYGDGTPVNVGTLLVGKGVRQPDLVGWVGFPVRSINHLTGEIYLRAGSGIAISENVNTSEITIVNTGVHSVNSLTGHVTIDALDGVKEEVGADNYLYIKGDWATNPPPPIAAQSQLGTQHLLVPIDHTHEGVHAVNGLLGDVSIDTEFPCYDYIAGNTVVIGHKLFRKVEGWRIDPSSGDYGMVYVVTPPIYENVPFVAYQWNGSQWVNVTSVLTDGDINTYVSITSTTPVRIYFSEYIPISRVKLYMRNTTAPTIYPATYEYIDGEWQFSRLQGQRTPPNIANTWIGSGWILNTHTKICNAIEVCPSSGTSQVAEIRVDSGVSQLSPCATHHYVYPAVVVTFAGEILLPAGKYNCNIRTVRGCYDWYISTNLTVNLKILFVKPNGDTVSLVSTTETIPANPYLPYSLISSYTPTVTVPNTGNCNIIGRVFMEGSALDLKAFWGVWDVVFERIPD